MKKLYKIQVFFGFLLYFIGFNLEQEQERLVEIFFRDGYEAGPYGEASMYFAIATGLYSMYCLLVALKTAQRLRRAGNIGSVVSFCGLVFSVIMFSSPRGISVDESFWGWVICIVLSWGWVIFVYQRIDAAPIIQPMYEDEILDDL